MSLLSELVPVKGGSGTSGIPVKKSEHQTAKKDQTVFKLTTLRFNPGYQDLTISVNGAGQDCISSVYTENHASQVTFAEKLKSGDSVLFSVIRME